MDLLVTSCLGFLALLANRVEAESGRAYHGPPPIKEVFTYNDRNFLLYSERVSWDEALAICKSKDGSLAVADNSGKAAFLSQSISEAWTPFEDLWIGGQKTKNAWQWVTLGSKAIPDSARQDENATFMYPLWIDGVVPNRFNRDCLAIDRNGHLDPIFVDLECRMPRPFICKQPEKKTAEDPIAVKALQILDAEYVLYHGRLTWEGAVAFCRQNGYTLASVKNLTVAYKLAVAMLKTRPGFEDVWIGGQFKNDRWTWVADSEEMAETSDFPPWQHYSPRKGKDCILFDRHLCDEPKFIDVKCNRVRDFVCMRPLEEEVTEKPVPKPVRFRKKLYILHTGQLTWDEAKIICEDNPDARMLELHDMDEVMFLMQAMADNKQEVDHVWLGGRLTNDEWTWVYTNEVIPPTDNDTGFPPWCDNEKIPDMSCLNLDRQNHLTPLLYGLECNVTQGVICAIEAPDKGKRVVMPDDKTAFTASFFNNSWDSAMKTCEEDVGALLTDVDSGKLDTIVQDFLSGLYYIGAKVRPDGTAVWINTSSVAAQAFALTPDPPYVPGAECLALRLKGDPGAVAVETIVNVNCHDMQPEANYVCREARKQVIDEEGADKETWKCDWIEGRGVDEKTQGKQCWRHCPKEQALHGSRKVTCTLHDWVGSQGLTALPECKDAGSSLSFIAEEIDEDHCGQLGQDKRGRLQNI